MSETQAIQPNIEAYRRYLQNNDNNAVVITDGGDPSTTAEDYITIDFDKFRGLSRPDTVRLADQFARAAEGRYASGGRLQTVDEIKRNLITEINAAQSGQQLFQRTGGGVSNFQIGVVKIDSATSSFNNFSRGMTGLPVTASANEERLFDNFVKEHETAHQMLSLNEGGADYIASVRLLEKYPGPETEAFLMKMADLRSIEFLRAAPADRAAVTDQYGFGNTTGINFALANRSNIPSIEERLHNAQTIDAVNTSDFRASINGRAVNIRPEIMVREALIGENPAIADNNCPISVIAKAAQRLASKGTFDQASPQEHIVEALAASTARMANAPTQAMAYAPTPVVSAPSMAL